MSLSVKNLAAPGPDRGERDMLFRQLPDACLLVDPVRDRIVDANEVAAGLFGLASGHECPNRFSAYFGSQLPALIAFTQAVLDKTFFWTNELVLIRGEETVPLEINGRKVDLVPGAGSLILIILRDANKLERLRTDSEALHVHRGGLPYWKRVEHVFREIERQNQLILSAAGEGIYGVDIEGRTTFVNPAAERMLGWGYGELIGRKMHGTIHHSHRDGSPYFERRCPIYAAFRDGEIHRVDDEEFWRRDGTSFPVEYTSTPIVDHGQLVGAVIVFSDISQRKSAEEKLRGVLQEVEKLKQRLELENAYLQEEIRQENNYHEIVGQSAAIQHVIHQIEMVAPTDANVLITGETGTGKELIARAIHEASSRRDHPLIRVNCAAIPRELFESEFFGHVKGAFTGATSSRAGRFELADGGTLFLDEVGEIPLDLQGKLLRVLQDQQFERVGSGETLKVDVRVIAATNRDLKIDVKNRLFREDLYFRLNVFPIESVPLRERRDDIPLLANHFLKRASQKFKKPGLKLSMADADRLSNYDWPGNIRELESIIVRAVIVAQCGRLQVDLPPPMSTNEGLARFHCDDRAAAVPVLTELDRKQRDKEALIKALTLCKGKVFGHGGAAEMLGVKPTTLSSRIRKYQLELKLFRGSSATGQPV
jgi:formate hydrogenlyase transcriptional activator